MDKVICIDKPLFLSPLEGLGLLREKYPEYKDEKLSYAGRLDPMATGVMLVLVGEENKNREKYLGLDKTYEFEALLGISTDSFDLLGVPIISDVGTVNLKEKVNKFVSLNQGKIVQQYPPYSGKTIDGVKMFDLAKQGKLPTSLPEISGEVFSLEFLGSREIDTGELMDRVFQATKKVSGKFRQDEIYDAWQELDLLPKYEVLKFRMKCTSGLFVRRLVDDMGRFLGGGVTTFSIRRTWVGSYSLKDCINI